MPELEHKKREGTVVRRAGTKPVEEEDEMSTAGLVGDFDDPDEVDSDEGEPVGIEVASSAEEEEDDDDDDPPVRARRSAPRASRRSDSASRSLTRAQKRIRQEVTEDFLETLEGLEFGPNKHKITITRLEPTVDPYTGKRISGLQGTFHRPVSQEEIQKMFGGGIYKVTIHGPRAETGRGTEFKAGRQIEIAGDPIPPKSPREEERNRERDAREKEDLVKTLLEREDQRAREAKLDAMNAQKSTTELLTKLLDRPQADPNSSMAAVMTPMMTMMQENEKRREEQARLDREREDRRREQEREEQRRREEQERQRYEADMRRQEQQFKLQMEQIKMQQQMMEAKMAAESSNNRQSLELMMGFMQRADSDKESRSKEQTQLQVQFMQQMNEMQRSMLESQLKMMEARLSEAKDKDDFFEMLEKIQTIKGILEPGDDRPGWERAIDKFADTIPSVIPGLSALRGSVNANAVQAPSSPVQQRPTPGSVVVVEDIDRLQAPVEHQQPRPQPLPQPQMPQQQLPAMEQPPAQQQQQESMTVNIENDLTEYTAYPESADNEVILVHLVKLLDFGLRQGADADELYEKCIVTLPDAQRQLLKALPVEVILGAVETNAPDEWPIRSPLGEERLREIHDKLASSA